MSLFTRELGKRTSASKARTSRNEWEIRGKTKRHEGQETLTRWR